MASWPGGPCPECGEDMPANLIRCVNCRALLNEDLELDSVEIPQFIPLQEIDSFSEAKPRGYYIGCPHCQTELRINARYIGKKLNCKSCRKSFKLILDDPAVKKIGFYLDCPDCSERLKVSQRHAGRKVLCKFCSSQISLIS